SEEREDELLLLPQPARIRAGEAARRRVEQFGVLLLPRRAPRPDALGAPARAGELPELPRGPWVEQPEPDESPSLPALPDVPHAHAVGTLDRGRLRRRLLQPGMYELPSADSWLEPTVRQDFSSLEAVKHEKQAWIRFLEDRGSCILGSDIRRLLRVWPLGR